MPLTDSQQQAHDAVISHFKSGARRVRLLGSAGTGKTFLAGEIVKTMKKGYDINTQFNNGIIFVTAPTNKALAVLKGKVNSPVEFATIHSALKLRKWTDSKTGRETFVRGSGGADLFKQAKACVIDEASMLGVGIEGGYLPDPDTQKMVYHKGHLDSIAFPILYLGDPKQINPVGEDTSAVWLKDYPTVTLTEIIRQGNGNPIIDLSNDLDMIYFKTPNLVDGKGYVYDNDKAGLIERLAEVNGTDELKYLAYSNSDVDDTNKFVRHLIYGNTPKKVEKGETLVINSPIAGLYTNQEIKVEHVCIITSDMPIPNSRTKFDSMNMPVNTCDKIRLKYYRVNDKINIIHEHSEAIFKEVFTALSFNCAKLDWNFKGKSFFKDQFADTKYNHAITIHKSLN